MENLLVAVTNLPVILPLLVTWNNNDFLSFFVIAFVGFFSFVSHLVENHKHGMPGFFSVSTSTSYLLNRFDVLGVYMTLGRFLYLYSLKFGFSTEFITKHYILIGALTGSFMLNIISEYDKSYETKMLFIITHSIWHISIFIIMAKAYQIFTINF
jgi:hypothetical protein